MLWTASCAQLMTVSGNVWEFENRFGLRYRCIKEDGIMQWFLLRTNQPVKRTTRAKVQICCKKFQREFGTFIDRSKGGVGIFPKSSGLTGRLASHSE